MDRSAPNPIPNSWREGGWEEGEENSQRVAGEGEWRYHV